MITLIGHKTLEAIMERVKQSNYYLVMMDCTHTAALCNSVLCQIKSRAGATVGKHFANFLPLSDTVVKLMGLQKGPELFNENVPQMILKPYTAQHAMGKVLLCQHPVVVVCNRVFYLCKVSLSINRLKMCHGNSF